MFQNVIPLQQVPLLNTAAGTNFTSMFQGCPSLQSVKITGAKYAIDYSNCMLHLRRSTTFTPTSAMASGGANDHRHRQLVPQVTTRQ